MLQQFKDGDQPLLIATDVAQRGLDIKVSEKVSLSVSHLFSSMPVSKSQ